MVCKIEGKDDNDQICNELEFNYWLSNIPRENLQYSVRVEIEGSKFLIVNNCKLNFCLK